MGDLGYLYKVYYKMFTAHEVENKEEFSAIKLKIRNRNVNSYRFYDENGETIAIDNKMFGGVYLKYDLESEQPSIISSFITDDVDMYQVVSGEIPPKNEEEKKSLEELKNGLKGIVEKALQDMLEKVKINLDKLAEQRDKEPINLSKVKEAEVTNDTSNNI